MAQYKYYLYVNSKGDPYRIYRGAPVYEIFSDSGLEFAKKDGSWSSEDREIRFLLNLRLKGDFVEESDEITEAQAMAYLAQWRATGHWPDEAYHKGDMVCLRGPATQGIIMGSGGSILIERWSIGTIVFVHDKPTELLAYDVKFYVKDQNCYALATIDDIDGDIMYWPPDSPPVV
jgi:hypothetical protein